MDLSKSSPEFSSSPDALKAVIVCRNLRNSHSFNCFFLRSDHNC